MGFFESLWNFFWACFWIFAFVAYLFALFSIITDIFRDRELGGWAKAIWLVFLVFLPFLTALVYLIARGDGMAGRSERSTARDQTAIDSYIRDVAGGPSREIARAKDLMDAGALSPAEFEQIKSKVLAA